MACERLTGLIGLTLIAVIAAILKQSDLALAAVTGIAALVYPSVGGGARQASNVPDSPTAGAPPPPPVVRSDELDQAA